MPSYFNQTHHKVPGLKVLYIKLTGAADVAASGYTVNVGSDVLASTNPAVRAGEGILDLTLNNNISVKELVGCSVVTNLNTLGKLTSFVVATKIAKFTFVDLDTPAATDPDNGVIYIRLDINTSGVGTL